MLSRRPVMAPMPLQRPATVLWLAFIPLLIVTAAPSAALQKPEPTGQLPEELRGAKTYRLPEKETPGKPAEPLLIYRKLSYRDIDWKGLALNLEVAVKPVDRDAQIRQIFFQDIRVNGIPVRLEPFTKEFKLSKKEPVDLPAPLACSIVFADFDSLAPVKEIVSQNKIRITGRSFIEVRLNLLQKLAVRSKRLVLSVSLDDEVPLEMFSGSPLLQMAATRILESLSDPSAQAAITLARARLQKIAEDRAVASLGKSSVYLLHTEFALRDPKTNLAEKFSQSGTGFLVSGDGKVLTAKRVIEPWKFDPLIAFLIERQELELDPASVQICAWAVGATVLTREGEPDCATAQSTEKRTLEVVKTAPDRMERQEYQDPNSGERATISVHVAGENDLAVLRLAGENLRSLALADPGFELSPDVKTARVGYPFGLSQRQAAPRAVQVEASRNGALYRLELPVEPGESGAPLVTLDGKVLALSGGSDVCIPIDAARALIQ